MCPDKSCTQTLDYLLLQQSDNLTGHPMTIRILSNVHSQDISTLHYLCTCQKGPDWLVMCQQIAQGPVE